jgi:hypothetical protein
MEISSMKIIKFENQAPDSVQLVTKCVLGGTVMVGSSSCRVCEHNIACDSHKQIVICKFDEPQSNDAPETPPRAEQLAEDHWGYVKQLLELTLEGTNGSGDDRRIEEIGFHYKSAMIHGWKHRDEDPKGHECVFTHNGRCVVCGRVSK